VHLGAPDGHPQIPGPNMRSSPSANTARAKHHFTGACAESGFGLNCSGPRRPTWAVLASRVTKDREGREVRGRSPILG